MIRLCCPDLLIDWRLSDFAASDLLFMKREVDENVDDDDADTDEDVDDILQIPLTRASGFTEEKLLRRKCGFKAKPSFDPDLWPIRRLWRQLTTFVTKWMVACLDGLMVGCFIENYCNQWTNAVLLLETLGIKLGDEVDDDDWQ